MGLAQAKWLCHITAGQANNSYLRTRSSQLEFYDLENSVELVLCLEILIL